MSALHSAAIGTATPKSLLTWDSLPLVPRNAAIAVLTAYRAVISPIYGDVCKYYPSCSAYGLDALRVHGALRGSWLIVRRLGRCHPWAQGGFDPVPGSQFEAEMARHPERFGAPDSSSGRSSPTGQLNSEVTT